MNTLMQDVDAVVRKAYATGFAARGKVNDRIVDRAFAKGMAIGALLVSAVWIASSIAP